MRLQVCLPVKNLDLGYNLVKTHDGSAAFLVVDHDEEEMITARAPIGNIYAPGAHVLNAEVSCLQLTVDLCTCLYFPWPISNTVIKRSSCLA